MFQFQVSEDLCLKILEPRHAKEIFELTDKNRDFLQEWLPWVQHVREEKNTLDFIQTSLQQFAENNGFSTGIWYQGAAAGAIGLHKIDWENRAASLGYWLGEEFQGKGIMTKVCKAMIDYLIKELELTRVEVRCAAGNLKSQAIPKRLGMVKEGVIRKSELLKSGFVDHIVYSTLAEEWNN